VQVASCQLPADALLGRYADDGGFTDCYHADLDQPVTLDRYVEAFYCGGLIRIERLLIGMFLSRPSSRLQVRQLARGQIDGFAAWRVEARNETQLLLCDVSGRTRSWLMVQSRPETHAGSRLYFGSAVVPSRRDASGQPRMGWLFGALLGFHRLYSRLLLKAASRRLLRRGA